MISRNQVELLAPAGDEECFKAAIAAGADAVYFGMEQFSARTRAKNITVNQAKHLIPLAHRHNCRAYLTLNTLITDAEIESALGLVKNAVECGIDAVIVQDLGVLKAVRENFPQLEIHASTQMTTHNLSQCKFLSELGVSQVNLSRELALPEIQELTDFLHSKNIVPEIFVQGAFCISYSGQCYLSGHLFGQAGNRGDCVQPCRRCWSAKSKDGKELCGSKALFHLKDNSAFPLADKLIRENVPVSLKIEGRIKNAEYVWAVTSAWREQIDQVLAEKGILKSSPKLTGAINRDYTCGYLEGKISGQMFSSGAKDISQIKAGVVKNYIADSKTLVLQNVQDELKKGDRLTIKTSSDQFVCTATVTGKSGNGYSIQITNKLTKKIFGGQIVYKSSSVITPEELKKIIEKISAEGGSSECCGNAGGETFAANVFVKAVENAPIEITYESEGQRVTVKSEKPLVKAQNAGLTAATLQQKLSKLGGTCFSFGSFTAKVLEPGLFMPLGELNGLRRKAVELLEEKVRAAVEGALRESQGPQVESYCSEVVSSPSSPSRASGTAGSTIANTARDCGAGVDGYLIDSKDALEKLIGEKNGSGKEYKIIYELPSAINLVDGELFELLNQNTDVVLYFNSILLGKDMELAVGFVKKLSKPEQRTILCENTGLAWELKELGCKIVLGANCNIYNSWNVLEYSENLNLCGMVPSLELSAEDVEKLCFPENIEIWYPKKLHKLLMQSRQCLVKNGSGCQKPCVDRNCVETCSKQLVLKGTQDEKVLAVKRQGFYSALYTAENVCAGGNVLKNKVSVWIVDKRF